MKFSRLLAVLIVLATSREGDAADSNGQFAIYGERSCWEVIVWMDTGNSREMDKLADWLGGFVTAYNFQTPDTINLLSDGNLNAALAWLAQWCRANPKSKIGDAMQALTQEFHPRRQRTVKDAVK